MSLDKIILQNFQVFLAVAESGGFTAAAKTLNLSKASISHSIRVLEDALKTPLFVRTTRKITLTDEGEKLYDDCLRLKDDIEVIKNSASNFHQNPTGILRINANPYLARKQLLKIIIKYSKLYPNVKIDIITEEKIFDLDKEQIDVVYGVTWIPFDEVVARPIGSTSYTLCASPKYLKKHGTPKSTRVLSEHKYINHSCRKAQNTIHKFLKDINTKQPNYMAFSDADLMKEAALMGLGLVHLHDYMVDKEIATGKLVEVLPGHVKETLPLYMYYQKHRYVQPKVRCFVNLALELK